MVDFSVKKRDFFYQVLTDYITFGVRCRLDWVLDFAKGGSTAAVQTSLTWIYLAAAFCLYLNQIIPSPFQRSVMRQWRIAAPSQWEPEHTSCPGWTQDSHHDLQVSLPCRGVKRPAQGVATEVRGTLGSVLMSAFPSHLSDWDMNIICQCQA